MVHRILHLFAELTLSALSAHIPHYHRFCQVTFSAFLNQNIPCQLVIGLFSAHRPLPPNLTRKPNVRLLHIDSLSVPCCYNKPSYLPFAICHLIRVLHPSHISTSFSMPETAPTWLPTFACRNGFPRGHLARREHCRKSIAHALVLPSSRSHKPVSIGA